MYTGAPSIHQHILFQRHGSGINLFYQFPNYRSDPNTCNSYGTTPLHIISLTYSEDKVAEELIASGAKVNAVNHFGSTPLHFAAIHRNQIMTEILLKHGAAVNMQDVNGDTALHFAIKSSDCLLYLQEYQAGDIGIIRNLISSGASINISNEAGYTPLMLAIIEGNLDIVKELLKFGANVNIRFGLETCLHMACKNVKLNYGIIMELVKHGACMNCLDTDGKTALDILLNYENLDHRFKWAKELIRVATLVNFEHKTYLSIEKDFILNESILKCNEEVSRMKSIKFTEKFGLCHFALNRQCSDNLSEEKICDKVLDSLSVYNFPIYLDFIASNFKSSYLRKKLLEMDIYARKDKRNAAIHLNRDVISAISSFLSNDDDYFNFIRAYTKSAKPMMQI